MENYTTKQKRQLEIRGKERAAKEANQAQEDRIVAEGKARQVSAMEASQVEGVGHCFRRSRAPGWIMKTERPRTRLC